MKVIVEFEVGFPFLASENQRASFERALYLAAVTTEDTEQGFFQPVVYYGALVEKPEET